MFLVAVFSVMQILYVFLVTVYSVIQILNVFTWFVSLMQLVHWPGGQK